MKWTVDEINILKNNQDKTLCELDGLLKNRNKNAIYKYLIKNKISFKKEIRDKTKAIDYNYKNAIYNNYKRKGIILDRNKLWDTYDIIEWYNFVLTNKINQIPDKIINTDSSKKLFKYFIEDILLMKTKKCLRNLTKKHFMDNKLWFKTYDFPDDVCSVINILYPEYDFKPWQLKMTGIKYFKKEENIIYAIEWLLDNNNLDIHKVKSINNYIDNSVEQLFSNNGLSCLITTSYFNGYQNLFVWYYNKIGCDLSLHDFNKKTNNYWSIKENADYQMKQYIIFLQENGLIKNVKIDLPKYFKRNSLDKYGYCMLRKGVKKNSFYENFYDWVDSLYPHFNLTENDFKIIKCSNNEYLFNSYEERDVFEFIYNDLDISSIESIGLNKINKFYNKKYNESYFPDFKVKTVGDNMLPKIVYIEYYGLYDLKNNSKRVRTYIDKTHRKNEYYKSNNNICFIDLYPDDLKNNFAGVRKKLTSLFMQNFNINLKGGESFEEKI